MVVDEKERFLFERMSVPKAVMTLAVPTIISQVVTMVYNLADTFFIGQIGDAGMLAAVSLVSPWFNLLTALGNLFGLGAGSLVSRFMGAQREGEIRYVSSFSLWCGILVTALFSLASFVFRQPLLGFLGASGTSFAYAESYLVWVVCVGGVPTVVSLAMGHMLRSEGHARQASLGMMAGGILNVILDPIFIFILGLDVAGAAIATMLSNCFSVLFFAIVYIRLAKKTAVSFSVRNFSLRYVTGIFSVGLASALATALGNLSNMTMVHLASAYGDVSVAAYGVVKRLDQFPLNVSMGLCQGFMPLVGYNYASGDYRRMRSISLFSWLAAMAMSALFVLVFEVFSPEILRLFTPESGTAMLGSVFLRIACIAVPFTSINFLISYTLQAMGKGLESAILTSCRQGLLNIPLLIVMDLLIGLYGMIWTQLVVELIMLPVSIGIYSHTFTKLSRPKAK